MEDFKDIDFKWSTDSEIKAEEEKKRQAELAALQQQQQLDQQAAESAATAAAQQAEPEQKEEKEGEDAFDFLQDRYVDNNFMGRMSAPGMGLVQGLMDLTSSLIPALKPVDDAFDELNEKFFMKDDPVAKTINEFSAIAGPTALIGGAGAKGLSSVNQASQLATGAGITGKTKALGTAAWWLGTDALVSATAEQTREPGNFANLVENLLPKGMQIPWATRDADSPDVVFEKNMFDNMLLGGVPFIFDYKASLTGGNVYTGLNPKGQELVDATNTRKANRTAKADGDESLGRVVETAEQKLKAQKGEAVKAIEADPEGQNYNAFVNEPGEPTARITLEETADPVEFMADQTRIQNNIGTAEGRSRPIIDESVQMDLANADAAARSRILSQVEGDLGAKIEFTVGNKKITSKMVEDSVNSLYDATISPGEATFTQAVKNMQRVEGDLLGLSDEVLSEASRAVAKGTIQRLVDAMSPYKRRASAAIQTQTAGSVSDIARNIDLMDDVVDTSRLQEILMPRLRVLLKEAGISEVTEKTMKRLQAKLKAKGEFGADDIDDVMSQLDDAVETRKVEVDEFIDNLTEMSKENPAYFRPVYNLYARTNGDVHSMHGLNKHLRNRLGIIRKSIGQGNPEIPSVVLSELNSYRTANLINGPAPFKALIANTWGMVTHPLHTFAGSVPYAMKGDIKPLQRALVGYSGIRESFERARRAFMDDLRFSNTNPNAARQRGRKDYQFDESRATGKDFRDDLRDFEELEELSETFSPGRKAAWNLAKGLGYWNRKSLNQWGFNLMYAGDGFLKQFMATLNSRVSAYDKLLMETNGGWSKADFKKLELEEYNKLFDEEGIIKPGFAKLASEQISLNAEVPALKALEGAMEQLPILKSIIMFPTTRMNALARIQSFDPTGTIGLWNDLSMKTIRAKSPEEIADVLEQHGMRGASETEFQMLKSNYIGRKVQSAGLVMTGAFLALDGRITGSMGWMSNQERRKRQQLGEQPYTVNLGTIEKPNRVSYAALPAEMKMFISLVSDVVQAGTLPNGPRDTEEWLRAISLAVGANVTNEMWGNELETLHGLFSLDPNAWNKYLAGGADSLLPGTSARGFGSTVLVPQLQDVENNWQNYLANRNRLFPPINDLLEGAIDPFDGKPVNEGSSPLEIALGQFFPFVKTKGDLSGLKAKILSTGWDGLQKPMNNPINGEKLSPAERNWIFKHMGEQSKFGKQVEKLMDKDSKWWQSEMDKYRKARGSKTIGDFPDKNTFVQLYLQREWDKAYDAAWNAFVRENPSVLTMKQTKDARDAAIQRGDYTRAEQLSTYLETLRQSYSY